MKKIEIVIKKLSNLYEFNQKLRTYKIEKLNSIKGQQTGQPDGGEQRSSS